jgi:hypothetical protein
VPDCANGCIAQEVGFIAGCCSVWQQRGADVDERPLGPRTKRAVEALALQIYTFPLHDPSNTTIDVSPTPPPSSSLTHTDKHTEKSSNTSMHASCSLVFSTAHFRREPKHGS